MPCHHMQICVLSIDVCTLTMLFFIVRCIPYKAVWASTKCKSKKINYYITTNDYVNGHCWLHQLWICNDKGQTVGMPCGLHKNPQYHIRTMQLANCRSKKERVEGCQSVLLLLDTNFQHNNYITMMSWICTFGIGSN